MHACLLSSILLVRLCDTCIHRTHGLTTSSQNIPNCTQLLLARASLRKHTTKVLMLSRCHSAPTLWIPSAVTQRSKQRLPQGIQRCPSPQQSVGLVTGPRLLAVSRVSPDHTTTTRNQDNTARGRVRLAGQATATRMRSGKRTRTKAPCGSGLATTEAVFLPDAHETRCFPHAPTMSV